MTERVERLTDPSAYRMLLPRCWTRLPMEPVAMRQAARAWLLRRYAGVSRDETVQVRRALEHQLVETTQRPGAEYARSLLVLDLVVEGRTVSASCLVSVVDHDLSDEERLDALARTEAVDAVECVVADLGPNRAVVVVRDEVTSVARPDDHEVVASQARRVAVEMGVVDDADDPEVVERSLGLETASRNVDVWLPVPDEPRALLLQFSTAVEQLAGPLTELFVVTAGTVQFRRPDGTWP